MRAFKKIIAFVSAMIVTLGLGSMPVFAADVSETQDVEYLPYSTYNSQSSELLDKSYFYCDGTDSFFSETPIQESLVGSSNNVITGTLEYFYDGLDSQNRPQYTVTATIVSSPLTLKSSRMKTMAEGTSSWHTNEEDHSGHTGKNTRSYVYTKNPPTNPYCKVRLWATDSEDFELYIGEDTLYDAKSH